MQIGFIGLGIMGEPVAKNLLAAGYPLVVRDTNPAAVAELTALGAKPIYGQMMTAALLCAEPVVALHLTFQRYLVGGLTAGGEK